MINSIIVSKRFVLLLVTLISSGLLVGNVSAADGTQHCIIDLETNVNANEIPPENCFSTFANAISAATDGVVQLPETALPGDIKLNSRPDYNSGRIVLGVMFSRSRYRGSSLTFYGYAGNCNHSSYSTSWIGKWFNDRATSMKVYAACHAIVYEHANFRGASLHVGYNRSKLGVLNNEISSVKFRK